LCGCWVEEYAQEEGRWGDPEKEWSNHVEHIILNRPRRQ